MFSGEKANTCLIYVVCGGFKHVLTIWLTWRVSYKKQELLTIRKHLGSSPFFGGCWFLFLFLFFDCGVRLGRLLSILCSVVFSCLVLFVVVLCFVCPKSPVFLDCPFSIDSSVFSNIYYDIVARHKIFSKNNIAISYL